MNRLIKALVEMIQGLSKAVLRFPLSVFCLVCETILTCYIISLHKTPELIVQKYMFTFMLGSFLGITAQFACERFKRLADMRLAVYGVAALLIVGYYFIILPAPAIDYGVGARTSVAVFSMFCAFIWLPSSWKKFDFNTVALVHFKSAFISILYASVLNGGLAAIEGAIDLLLFRLNSDVYGYTSAIVWIMFATVYFLSLLPNFNSERDEDIAYTREVSQYPRFLEILVSYIAVPLVAAFTLVLLAYFIKIGFDMNWPSGRLGPMILSYSASGLIVYVLASRLENRFAILYQKIFPKVLIPIVIMQLISVYIRINAYGFTEGRYYVGLFGLYSIVIGILLSFKPVSRNGLIAILGAAFAIFSILPPVDAFTTSRHSQVNRLDNMLRNAGVLADNTIQPKSDVDMTLRLETTSIMNYLERRRYLEDLPWLPADFQTYRDFQSTFGFEPAYESAPSGQNFFFAGLNMQTPLDISGYDVLMQVGSYQNMDARQPSDFDFQVGGAKYKLKVDRLSVWEARVSVVNAAGTELVSTGLYDFATSITGVTTGPKEGMDAAELTLDAEANGCRLRIIFQNINITFGTGAGAGANYDMFILVDVPK